jgi:hypothetical protein
LLDTEALGPSRRATQIRKSINPPEVHIHYNRAHHETIEPLLHTLFLATTQQWRSSLEEKNFFKIQVNDFTEVRAKDEKGSDIGFRAYIHNVKLERPVKHIWVSIEFTKLDPIA